MQISDRRRINLRKLLNGRNQRELADLLGLSPAYLNQLLSGHRGIGERTARKIEKAGGRQPGWLDEAQTDYPIANGTTNNQRTADPMDDQVNDRPPRAEPLYLTDDEREWLQFYHALGADQRAAAMIMARYKARKPCNPTNGETD